MSASKIQSPIKTMSESPIPMKESPLADFLADRTNSPYEEKEMTLGYIWGMVLKQAAAGKPIASPNKRRHIKKRHSSRPRDVLLRWAIEKTKNYDGVKNFKPPELAFLALIDVFCPDMVNFHKLDHKTRYDNAKKLVSILNELGISVFSFNELVEKATGDDDYHGDDIDEKSLLAQIAAIKVILDNPNDLANSAIKPRAINFQDENHPEEEEEDQNHQNEQEEEQQIEQEEEQQVEQEQQQIEQEQEQQVEQEEEEQVERDVSDDFFAKQDQLDQMFAVSKAIEGDNSEYAGRKFALIMDIVSDDGQTTKFALAMDHEQKPYLNPAGIKLVLVEPEIDTNPNTHFVFGQGCWNTVIDPCERRGMVWDVADEFSLDPPAGTQFYLFPFHGRHNQHFVYRDNHIYAQQNGHVVTFVGGEQPLVMMALGSAPEDRQTFRITLLD